MKKRFFPIMLLMAALGITSCTDDNLVNTGGNLTEDDGTYTYINASITLPSSSMRSATDNEGDTNSDAQPTDSEVGADYENEVRSMILVIADKDNKYISHSVVQNLNAKPNGDYEVIGGFKTSELQAAYQGGDNALISATNNKVNIYAFCNYTARLLDLFENEDKTNWLDWNGVVEEGPSPAGQTPTISNTIWAKRSFLMTNAEQVEATFPETFEEWEPYSDKSNAYDIIAKGKSDKIKVERAAARIDFKDGSGNTANPNTYPIETAVYAKADQTNTPEEGPEAVDDDVDDDDAGTTYTTKNFFSVKLTRMALVNMSKNFYYLRRTSDDGSGKGETNTNNWKVGGVEERTGTITIGTGDDSYTKNIFNYVVDTDWEAKKNGSITEENESQYFNFALFNSDKSYNKDGWYIDNIGDVLKENGTMDNWNDKSYHVWRYVTENTIPAKSITKTDGKVTDSDDSPQQTVQSTGVVFKGAITLGEEQESEFTKYMSKAVHTALSNSAKGETDKSNAGELPVLYSFNNTLYAGYKELILDAKEDGEGGPLYNAVNKILSNWKLTYSGENKPTQGEFTYNPTVTNGQKVITLNVDTCAQILNKAEGMNLTVKFKEKDSDEDDELIMSLAANSGITVYEATNENDNDGWGYYCYYFYWNRHNDNGLSGKMGQMEFATVRNNVYKLSVSKISQLGHPRDTKHDPDPVDPTDPDEDPTNYLKVNVEVLPWVVRVNDIEF